MLDQPFRFAGTVFELKIVAYAPLRKHYGAISHLGINAQDEPHPATIAKRFSAVKYEQTAARLL